MTENKLSLNVFIGYQIESKYHNSSDYSKFGESLTEHLSENNIGLDIEFGEFSPGGILYDKVQDSIRQADICILDISENNPNVLFEAGLAVGNDNIVIMMKNSESKRDDIPLPTDIAGHNHQWYNGKDDLTSESTIESVVEAIVEFVDQNHAKKFYLKSLWGLGNVDRTILACSHIADDEHRDGEEYSGEAGEFYEKFIKYRRFRDLDSLIIIRETIQRLYPNMAIDTVDVKSKNDLVGLDSSNLIIIGGMEVNPVFLDFENRSPFSYDFDHTNNDIFVRDATKGKELGFEFNKNMGSAKDHGFFVKRALEGSRRRKLIIVGGIHTWGTVGVSKIFEYSGEEGTDIGYRNAKTMINKYGDDPHFGVCTKISGSYHRVDRNILGNDDAIVQIKRDDQWNHAQNRSMPIYMHMIDKR